jgi:hypothetical protein
MVSGDGCMKAYECMGFVSRETYLKRNTEM